MMALIWKPLLLRALIAAVFGALTIFWQEPSALVMGGSGAFYLIGTGVAMYWLRDRLRQSAGSSGDALTLNLLRSAGIALAVGGVLIVIFPTPEIFSIVVTIALLPAGAVEIFLGLRHRRTTVIGRDWLITGVVNAATGLILPAVPLFAVLEPHALLGVLGGSAIITAVVLLLAALGYRHEAQSARPVHHRP
ncbi:DUF308 domain-containing protein [Arthrobacter sp. H14]|uniref:DUF308 domain-containing protein n=1 Tax=Arthrobacter sp. H14 TaxID=1312959 RepID=UPI0004BCC66C|nr:DUF308 domain-containing protein [Arthrobacter sp. H14]